MGTEQFLSGIAYTVGFITLYSLGWSDLRQREISKYEWRYLVLLSCGILLQGGILQRLAALVLIPAIMVITASIMVKIKNNRETREFDISNFIGGADIKTIAGAGFLFGLETIPAAIVLSTLMVVPFVFFPKLGVKKELRDSDEHEGIPFCTLLAFSITILFVLDTL